MNPVHLPPLLVAVLAVQVVQVLSGCKDQIYSIVPGRNVEQWVDADTPDAACTTGVPGRNMVLVFSDEFNKAGRKFGAKDDPRWTARDLYYYPTADHEVYKPKAVTTNNGAAVVTFSQEQNTAKTQQPDGKLWTVRKDFTSGMVDSWNKFCFTGGYVEAAVRMPGDDFHSGLWAALWMMGNLGRAGYMKTTTGLWPYSYNQCEGSGQQAWDSNPGQLASACDDPQGFNRSKEWGFAANQGRGAPEIDIFELRVDPSNQGTPENPTSYVAPTISQTLQMAPLMPGGVSWLDEAFYAQQGIQQGVLFPGASTPFNTQRNEWYGPLTTDGSPPRPGNLYQDSISATSALSADFFNTYHKYGLMWQPGEYIRWYIDDVFVYEVNKNALIARQNASGASVGERLIPLEPMHLIFNVAMADDFAPASPNLALPASMLVDYVRVYQDASAVNVDCSPAGFPTAQYISKHKGDYVVADGDGDLVKGNGAGRVALSWGLLGAAALGVVGVLML